MTSIPILPEVNEIADRIRAAARDGRTLRVTGGGNWLDAGRPVAANGSISTAELTGIVSYVPGDLTLTARAGTTLAEIRAATAEHNQWLALDPYGDDRGTLGATAATASSGPLATSFGSPRDLVLGVEFVTGRGAVARGGGRVVKNVAGFDLTRMMIGSWGTLGVITELTVRLHARPEADVTIAVPIERDGIGRVRTLLRRLPFTPYACEILNPPLAQRLLGTNAITVLFRLGGNADAVSAQRRALDEIGPQTECAPDIWESLRAAEPAGAAVIRLSNVPSEIAGTWDVAEAFDGALMHAAPSRGIVRVIVPATSALPSLARIPATTTRIGERLPATAWRELPNTSSTLRGRVKLAFDPSDVLNRGILGSPS